MVNLDLPLKDGFGSFNYKEEEERDNYTEFGIIYYLFIYGKSEVTKNSFASYCFLRNNKIIKFK